MIEVYERGQMVLPKYVRDILNIGKGTKLCESLQDGGLFLKPSSSWLEEFRELRKEATSTDEEIEQAIKEAHEKRHRGWSDVYRR